MKITSLPVVAATAVLYMALGVQAAECVVGGVTKNCCWGDKDGGSMACKRQRKGNRPKDEYYSCESEEANWCSTLDITKEECDADCCDTNTRKGITCP
ncbi:uncharacterized protein CTRU02_202635 [Colletotrichum truncatum]|uniref:Uncharacterized protein n=1 Tax=Colletotrichum truncatum TaxID=5467 RepID=A0ACC3ZL96_COLTU|nr:uncharacterized protein CTRU02_10558 [Colletotrichum truncatum]KAF6786859.1 hypothetical protein CTRU02_10558 [Colletotrichum truncatum]